MAIWTDVHYRYNRQPIFPSGWGGFDNRPIYVYTPEPAALLLALVGLALLP